MTKNLFESEPIPQAVLKLSLPMLAGMALTVVYNMTDMIFVGMTGDADQIAVITLLAPVSIIVMAIGGVFGVGGGSCISRLLGMNRRREAGKTCAFCFYATALIGALCTAAGLWMLPWILRLLGSGEELAGLAGGYGAIVIGSTVPASLSFAMNQMVRAKGNAKESMYGMGMASVINMLLDPPLILGAGLGARGAALAAMTADLCAAVYFIRLIVRDEVLSVSPRSFTLDRSVVCGVLAVGVPACLTHLLICCSSVLFNRLAMSHGKEVTAAFGVASRVLMVPSMAAMGIARGGQPLVGYNYASGNLRRMEGAIRFSCGLGTILCVGFAFLVYFKSGGLIQIFTNDPDVVWLGTVILDAMAMAIPTAAVEAVLISTFQAMGKTSALLILSAGKQILLYIPMMIAVNHIWGLGGLILLEPLKEYVTVLLAGWLYSRERKRWPLR